MESEGRELSDRAVFGDGGGGSGGEVVVLGGLKAQCVPIKAALTAVVTICTCYMTSSVILGHTPLWLPDITHCARGSPERYFFRIGMSCSCCMLIVVWVLAATWAEKVCNPWSKARGCSCHAVSNDKACLYGAVGCLLLIMGSCCIEPGSEMPWTFHTIGATGFFLCQIVAICSVTTNVGQAISEAQKSGTFPPGVCKSAFTIKRYCVYFFGVALVLEIVTKVLMISGPVGAILEWLLTINVMVWVTSLSFDFKESKIYAAAIEPQSVKTKAAF